MVPLKHPTVALPSPMVALRPMALPPNHTVAPHPMAPQDHPTANRAPTALPLTVPPKTTAMVTAPTAMVNLPPHLTVVSRRAMVAMASSSPMDLPPHLPHTDLQDLPRHLPHTDPQAHLPHTDHQAHLPHTDLKAHPAHQAPLV